MLKADVSSISQEIPAVHTLNTHSHIADTESKIKTKKFRNGDLHFNIPNNPHYFCPTGNYQGSFQMNAASASQPRGSGYQHHS